MTGTLVRDMTEGSPTQRIVEFFFPLLFGLLFQQVYNMVDTIVVGKFLGVKALAGVGSTGSLSFLVLGFCIGVCNGFAIPVAQKFGERDYPGLKRFVVNAILLAVTFSLVITAVVCALCSPLLGWMNTPSDIVDDAYAYIFVIFLGIPVVFIYNVLFSIIRSLGDSRTPVIYLVICSLLNVVLDLLFIVSFGMGVEGAAWADGDFAGRFFAAVRPLHSPLRSDCADPPGLETGQNLCEKAHRHGRSHGIAVLDHGHRFHRAAGVGQSAGLQLCGQRGGGGQSQPAVLLYL